MLQLDCDNCMTGLPEFSAASCADDVNTAAQKADGPMGGFLRPGINGISHDAAR
jgi:hypothetical protein